MGDCTSGADQFHFASWLVYAGATIGRRATLWYFGHQYPIFYVIIVGDSGSAKKDTCADFAADTFRLQEQLPSKYRQPEDEETLLPYTTMDSISTAEGLLQHMVTAKAERLVVHTSEFDGVISKARRETGQGVMPLLMTAWMGRNVLSVHTRKDPLRVENPHIGLIATITASRLAKVVSYEDIESGFANRVLWVYGHGKGYLEEAPQPDELTQIDMVRRFLANTEQAVQASPKFVLTPAAKALRGEWARTLEDPENFWTGGEKTLAERSAAIATRIAMVFAASDGDPLITEDQLHAAKSFVVWSQEHIKRESRMWGANDEARLETQIRTVLKHAPLTASDLYNRFAVWGAGTIRRALDNMMGLDAISIKGGLYTLAGSRRAS
jgi:hypothetical protein